MDTWFAELTCCRVVREDLLAQRAASPISRPRPVVALSSPGHVRYADFERVLLPLLSSMLGLTWGRLLRSQCCRG